MNALHLLKAAQLSVDLVEQRDSLKQRFGARYQEVVEIPLKLLRSICGRTGRKPLDVCLELCNRAMRDGHGSACLPLIAAAVDMTEGGR